MSVPNRSQPFPRNAGTPARPFPPFPVPIDGNAGTLGDRERDEMGREEKAETSTPQKPLPLRSISGYHIRCITTPKYFHRLDFVSIIWHHVSVM